MSTEKKTGKYNAIVKTAHDLFWKFGIRRVTIGEICQEAGASKMTFYRFFPNKNELAKEVVKNLFKKISDDYRKIMDQDISFEEKVKQQLIMKFEGVNQLSPELIKDIYGNPESEIYKLWKSLTDEIMQMVYEDYSQAQEKGWVRKDMNLKFIFYMSNKTVEMASDEQLQAMYPDMQSLIMEIANYFFYGIMPRTQSDE
ncbi:MAG: TetR/AcrR family transcriptional regulator [Bacteroidales bacterium]|jgi:hypothetical protein